MGARGPRPTPTSILELRGSRRAKLNRGEPQPAPGLPDPPVWLDAEGLAVWNEITPMLDEMGVLTRIDGLALARYCSLWADWIRARQFVSRHGTTYPIKDGNGKVKCFGQFPEVALLHKLSLALSRMEAEFGLTPSARTRLNVPIRPLPDNDLIKEFFKGSAAWAAAVKGAQEE